MVAAEAGSTHVHVVCLKLCDLCPNPGSLTHCTALLLVTLKATAPTVALTFQLFDGATATLSVPLDEPLSTVKASLQVW